jgi:hypothetical protein
MRPALARSRAGVATLTGVQARLAAILLTDLYREKVTQLARGLEYEESRTAAAEALRGLIDAIVLTPLEGELKIELQGNLAAMLKAAHAQSTRASLAPLGRWEDARSPDDDDLVQIMLVAGAGFEPATFGL